MADAKLIYAQRKLRLTGLGLEEVGRPPFLGPIFVVCDFDLGVLSSLSQPLDALSLICSHAPAVSARQGIKKHGSGVVLLGGMPEVIC